jgi:hypothetical protein
MDVSGSQGAWSAFLHWMEVQRIGDLSGVAGVLISVIGFIVTATAAVRAKNAAESAKLAARAAVDKIRLLETVIDFSTAITLCEEIKTLCRAEQFVLVPDRCAAARKLLIALRSKNKDLSNVHQAAIQAAIVYLKDLEGAIARKGTNPGAPKLLALMAQHIDELVSVLSELRAKNSEG